MSDPLVFWLSFAFLMVVPVIITASSSILRTFADSEPNSAVGFRTKLSVSSKEAWTFANLCCARLWKKMGLVMLGVTTAAMFAFSWLSGTAPIVFITILSGLQIVCMLLSIAYVQKHLRAAFNPDGTRRSAAGSAAKDE